VGGPGGVSATESLLRLRLTTRSFRIDIPAARHLRVEVGPSGSTPHEALPPRRTAPDPSLEGVADAEALDLASLAPSGVLWWRVVDVAERATAKPQVDDPSDAVLLEAVAAAQRLEAAVAATCAELVAALDARWSAEAEALASRDPHSARDGRARPFTDLHVGARLHLSPGDASRLVWRSTQLAGPQGPRGAVLAALADGHVSRDHADLLVDRLAALPDAVATAVEREVLPDAGQLTVQALARRIGRTTCTVDPAGADERAEAARARRGVSRWAEPEGQACLQIRGPAAEVEAIYQALDARGRRMRREAAATTAPLGTLDQWRFDAAAAVASAVLEGGLGPVARTAASRPVAHITLPASVAMGLSDLPGHLRDYGPVPASVARRIAADATWQRMFTDPLTGVAVGVEEPRYRPSLLLTRLVRARYATCPAPGCGQPSWRSDADHRRPWPDGPTAAWNLAPACRYHHLAKHSPLGMSTDPPPDGSSCDDGVITWRSPTGHTYRSGPDALDVQAPGD
jgi:hypothetical protein